MFNSKKANENGGSMKRKNVEQIIFYWAVLIIPLIQFAIFYLAVNFKSILFAFQEYDVDVGYSFVGLVNFKTVIANFASGMLWRALGNSLLVYALNLLVGTGLGLIFSYYVYKKFPAAGFFRVMLFLPHIISAVVMGIIYSNLVEKVLFTLNPNISIQNRENGFSLVLFFTLWLSFGTNVLIYVSSMSGISVDVVEAAQLDGVNSLQEFFYITLPSIYNAIVSFVVLGLAGLFTNQMNLYTFYGKSDLPNPDYLNIGFYLYREVQKGLGDLSGYGYLSAFGLILTLVAVPLTLGTKKAMEKFGPSAE